MIELPNGLLLNPSQVTLMDKSIEREDDGDWQFGFFTSDDDDKFNNHFKTKEEAAAKHKEIVDAVNEINYGPYHAADIICKSINDSSNSLYDQIQDCTGG